MLARSRQHHMRMYLLPHQRTLTVTPSQFATPVKIQLPQAHPHSAC